MYQMGCRSPMGRGNFEGKRDGPIVKVWEHSAVFCSLAVLDPRVGHIMEVLSPFVPCFLMVSP